MSTSSLKTDRQSDRSPLGDRPRIRLFFGGRALRRDSATQEYDFTDSSRPYRPGVSWTLPPEYGKYRLGPSLSLLSKNSSRNGQNGTLLRIRASRHEKAYLGNGGNNFFVHQIGSGNHFASRALKAAKGSSLGFLWERCGHYTSGAASKALLAFLPDRDIETIVQAEAVEG